MARISHTGTSQVTLQRCRLKSNAILKCTIHRVNCIVLLFIASHYTCTCTTCTLYLYGATEVLHVYHI